MPTTFQRKPSILQKLLISSCCFSLGLSGDAATHTRCVYSRPAHCSLTVQSKSLQAGRLALLLTELHNKGVRSANESPAEEIEEFWRNCKNSICNQVHNASHTKSYLDLGLPALFTQKSFYFFLHFLSSSTQTVLLVL